MTALEPTGPRRRRPRDRRQQILSTGSRLFAERGFHDVSMTDVATDVGVTAGGLYRHFASKSDLLFEVVADGLRSMRAVLDESPGLDAYIRANGLRTLQGQDLPALWQREAQHLPDEQRAELRQQLRENAEQLGRLVAAVRTDLVPGDVDFLTWSLISAIGSFGLRRVALPKRAFLAIHHGLLTALTETSFTPSDFVVANGTEPFADAAKPWIQVSRREQLINEAIRLFDDRGFQSVRMEDIGAAAGISGSSIYNHFETKDDLLFAALIRGEERIATGLARAVADGTTSAEVMDLLLRDRIDLALGDSHLVGVLASEAAELPERARDVVLRSQRSYRSTWIKLLRDTHPGHSQATAAVVLNAAFSVIDNLARMRVMRERGNLSLQLRDAAFALLRYDGDPIRVPVTT